MIDTNHNLQIPALLHSIVETFGRDGVTQNIFSDKDFLNWVNKRLITSFEDREDVPSHIGKGVGTQVEYSGESDSNKDPFVLLVPDKGMQ